MTRADSVAVQGYGQKSLLGALAETAAQTHHFENKTSSEVFDATIGTSEVVAGVKL